MHTNKIFSYLAKRSSRYRSWLRRMVGINSFTSNPNGIQQLGNLTIEMFDDFGFDFSHTFIPSQNPDYGEHLFLSSNSDNPDIQLKKKKIALISHLDTVYSPEIEETNNFSWKELGGMHDLIVGPGVMDIKGGTVLMAATLDALRDVAPSLYHSIDWHIAFNASEEVMASDFGSLCRNRLGSSDDCLACLVFESGGISSSSWPLKTNPLDATFSVVTARKGMCVWRVIIIGREAHAGNHHDQGKNAITALSRFILKIESWTNYDIGLTFNVGAVQGGCAHNTVCGRAEALIEMRADDVDVFQNAIKKIEIICSRPSKLDALDIQMQVQTLVQPWPSNSRTNELSQIWKVAANNIGCTVAEEERGGLSDGNWLWDAYPTLDGLGLVGWNPHQSGVSDNMESQQKDSLKRGDVSKELTNPCPGIECAAWEGFIPKGVLNVTALLHLIKNNK